MKKLIRNRIKCNHCNDIIESTSTHNFVRCSCGKCCVDGGTDYIRREYDSPDDFTELSEFEEVPDEEIDTLVKSNPVLNSKQQDMIEQVAATMALSGMTLTPDCYDNLQDIATGKRTVEEVIAETIRKYKQPIERMDKNMIAPQIIQNTDVWNQSDFKNQYFQNMFRNTNYVLCSVSAAEYQGLCNCTTGMKAYVLTKEECLTHNIQIVDTVGVLHTTINQTINDLLADPTMDEQVIMESLAELYFKNNYEDLNILPENQSVFEHFRPMAEAYYNTND